MPAADQPIEISPKLVPVVQDAQSTFSQSALNELAPVLTGIRSVDQSGPRITIQRDGPTSVPVGGDFLNSNIEVKTLNFGGSVSFDYDRNTHALSNIAGVSLNISFFGSDYAAALKNARLGKDQAGNQVLNAEFASPLPTAAQRILGMPNVVNVEIPVLANGSFGTAHISQVFSDAAKTTGPSIAGLLTSDALNEASKVALFAESNPKWVGQVVDPALRQIYKQLLSQTEPDNPAPATSVHVEGGTGTGATNPGKANPAAPGDANLVPKNATGAPVDVTKPGDYDFSTTITGVERHYKIHVPPSYDPAKPMPLVLLLHGHSQDGAEIARLTKMSKVADREGFIAVYPDARTWAGRDEWRAWDTDNGLTAPGEHADDVGFLRHIINTAEQNYKVDPQRIFMGGLSNGGMMAYRAAGELSDKVAAVAIISGAMSGKEPPLKAPISILNMHGTEDEIIPYEGLKNVPASLNAVGLPNFKPQDYSTRYWVEQNKITDPPIVERKGNVTQRRYINSSNGVEVDEYTIAGGHHVPDDIDGTVNTIWQFLKAHPKATGPVSHTQQPKPEEPLDVVERLQQHVRTRGIHGLEMDTGDMLNEVQSLGDGTFSPSNTLSNFEKRTGVRLDDGISNFARATDKISMTGQHIEFDLSVPQQISIDRSAGGATLKSITFDDPAFDLIQQQGRPALQNIRGINFQLNAAGRDLSVSVKDIAQKLDGSGVPYYRMRTDNPLPGWMRTALFAKSQVPIELQLNSSGIPTVKNEGEVKDAMLGVNPITRGYMDVGSHVYNLANNMSPSTGFRVAADATILAGTGYGAYRLSAWSALKLGTKGRVGLVAATVALVAPSLIHGLDRLLD